VRSTGRGGGTALWCMPFVCGNIVAAEQQVGEHRGIWGWWDIVGLCVYGGIGVMSFYSPWVVCLQLTNKGVGMGWTLMTADHGK